METFFSWIGAIVTAASAIVKVTPTTKDDTIVGKIVAFISKLSIFNTKSDEEVLKNKK